MIVAPVVVAIMSFFWLMVVRELSLGMDELVAYRGTVKSITPTKCLHTRARGGDYYAACVEIETVEKQFMLRLDASVSEDLWPALLAPQNLGMEMEARLSTIGPQTFVLYNPRYLRIDDRIVIPFDHNRGLMYATLACITFAIAGFAYLFYLAYKSRGSN